jgi:hypothetical protein
MKKLFTLALVCLSIATHAQTVEVDLFQKEATLTTTKIGIRARATGASVQYIGVTFYMLYQSANAVPLTTALNTVGGVDDSKLVTTFGWGTSARFTNPQQAVTIDPGVPGGQVYDRRYVYGNIDETGGSNIRTLTSAAWDTLLYITLNTLQPTYPQGGYAYLQRTSEAPGAALSDPGFANIAYLINSGDVALGINLVPVTFTRFDAKCNGNGTLISWSTAQESNSRNFEIQKSINSSTWETVGNVAAAGNSTSHRTYQQLDLAGGTALYRIKQVDLDGQYIYTNIERATCESRNIGAVIYPVPARDVLNVVIKSDRTAKTQLMVYETSGKLVRKVDVTLVNGNNSFKINTAGLASGDYLIRSSNNEIDLNKKFTVVN